jgi:hypothetical protein
MDPTNGCGLSLFAHGCSLSASSVLLIAAHPDDIKNCTGVILRCLELGAQVFEVLVTKGENLLYCSHGSETIGLRN